jgi:pimeloyl-ACP methyl ester carboxylesterase
LLAAERLVIAPDLPGFGESAPAGPGFDLEQVAIALADQLAERAVETLDDAAHVPQIERPAEFVAALRRVLSRLDTG